MGPVSCQVISVRLEPNLLNGLFDPGTKGDLRSKSHSFQNFIGSDHPAHRGLDEAPRDPCAITDQEEVLYVSL
jgi:hypothetical protein